MLSSSIENTLREGKKKKEAQRERRRKKHRAKEMVSEKTHMANVEGDETMEELGSFVAVSDHSLLDDEQSMLGQQDLYGTITPSPIKEVKLGLKLPKLKEKLEFPKQRKRTSSFDVHVRKEKHGINQQKRPSTCGKEGVRNFSSPLPLKVKSLLDTSIPCLLPESVSSRPGQTLCVDSSDSSMDLSFHTPQMDRTKPTSPLSVRSFSTPLADIRSKSLQKTAVQIQLSQLSSKEYLEEAERQLQRDILKYQSEINMMRKIRKYRKSKEDEKLDNVIEEWKEVAQKASNYMLNEATYKIERMGGIEEFRKRQKKTKLRKLKFEFDESLLYRIEEFMETAEYRNMDSYEKEEVMSRKKELEEMSEKIERGEIPVDEDASENDDDGDFSMRELYKQLGLDYKLVYG